MRFNKDHKVDIKTLNIFNARGYINFLQKERERHENDGATCGTYIIELLTEIDLWKSAIKRHQGDVKDIDKLIKQVSDKFNLGG